MTDGDDDSEDNETTERLFSVLAEVEDRGAPAMLDEADVPSLAELSKLFLGLTSTKCDVAFCGIEDNSRPVIEKRILFSGQNTLKLNFYNAFQ